MKFSIIEPETLFEAVQLLQEDNAHTKVIAGGTDLLVRIKRGMSKPTCVVSIAKIKGLDTLEHLPGQGLKIGAMVTHAEVAENPLVLDKCRALALACKSVGSPQIRNIGTVVGNLANASPAADSAPALLALGAELVVWGVNGSRTIALDDFFCGPGQTVLAQHEIIECIVIPTDHNVSSTFIKLGRRKALEIAICNVSVAASWDGERWKNVRVALGAVSPTPVLASNASKILEETEWSAAIRAQASKSASAESRPIDDARATADYRYAMVEVLVNRAVNELEQRKEVGIYC